MIKRSSPVLVRFLATTVLLTLAAGRLSQVALRAVGDAVLAKQINEGNLIRKLFYFGSNEDLIAQCEAQRAELIKAIHAAFVPVAHTIRMETS